MQLLRCEDNFFSSFLSPWLLAHQASPLYQDTMVYCKNEMMKTNRLVMGLIFPQLECWEGFTLVNPVEVILPDWERREVEERIEKLLGGQNVLEDDNEFSDWIDATKLENLELKTDKETEVITMRPKVVNPEDEDAYYINEEEIDFIKRDILDAEEDDQHLTLQKDLTDEKSTKKWNCNICKMSFGFIDQLKMHALENHPTLKFLKCQYCYFQTHQKKSLKRHENIHTKETQHPCGECEKSFLDKHDLTKHQASHSTEGPVQCDLCEKSFKSTFRLSRHKSLIHRQGEDEQVSGQFVCDICRSVFKAKDYLKRHMKHVHSGYQFRCSICDKRFKRNSHLKDHKKLHLGQISSTSCTICAFVIKVDRKDRVESHMQTHYKTSTMKCDKCEYYFRSQIYLIQHAEIAHSQ